MNFRPMMFDKEISESSKLIGFLNGTTYAIITAAVLQKPWTYTGKESQNAYDTESIVHLFGLEPTGERTKEYSPS